MEDGGSKDRSRRETSTPVLIAAVGFIVVGDGVTIVLKLVIEIVVSLRNTNEGRTRFTSSDVSHMSSSPKRWHATARVP